MASSDSGNHFSAARRFDAVLCDIDGCLGPETMAPLDAGALGELAAHNRLAIQKRDRPVLTLCSGRPQPFAEALCRITGNDAVPCVCENGVWLFDPSDGAYVRDPAIGAAHFAAVAAASAWIERELGPGGVVIQPGKVASVSIWHHDTAFLMSLKPRLARVFKEQGWPFRVSNTVSWINCDLEFVSKGSGIRRFIARTGIPKERLAGIGDTPSDRAIAENVAWFACPSNGDPALRPLASYVSGKPEVHGVLDILRRLSGTTRGAGT